MNHDVQPPPLTIDALLQEEQWLARFVRHLVDPADADDVIQDTWLAALRNPPRHRAAVRTWLGTVARNLARQVGRVHKRRDDCQKLVAKSEAVPSTEATVDRLATVAVIVQAVMSLEDPYRSAVLLRHYHRLPIREVARRTGVAEPTARQHVKRGLDQVRQSVLERYGSEWRGAVHILMFGGAQSLSVATPLSSVTIGVTLMSKQVLFGSVAALALGGVALTLYYGGTDPVVPSPTVGSSSANAVTTGESVASDETTRVERSEVAATSTDVGAGTAQVVRYSGRVLDLRGLPVAGIRLFPRRDRGLVPLAESDGTGRFEFESSPRRSTPVLDRRFVAIRAPLRLPVVESGEDLLYIVAPRVRTSGVVTDPRGNALKDVSIVVELSPLVSFPEPLGGTRAAEFAGGAVDAFGCFELGDLPGGSARLRFAKAGFQIAHHEVPTRTVRGTQIVLRPLDGDLRILTGRVLDADEVAVPDAVVGFGEATVHSDRYGAYRIEYDPKLLAKSAKLYAAKAGYQTRVVSNFAPKPPDRQTVRDIRLQGPALTIRGVVLDPEGKPLRGVSVLLWKEEPIVGSVFAENLAIDKSVKPSPYYTNPRAYGRTSEKGAFTIPGLSDREYRLRVFHPDYLAITSEPIAAGSTDVELRYPADGLRSIEGRVISRDGDPISGIRVRVIVPIHQSSLGTSWQWGRRIIETDRFGRFSIPKVPRADAIALSCNGASIINHHRPLASEEPDEIEIVVDRRCHFRVESDLGSGRIRLRNAKGELLRITRFSGGDASTNYEGFDLAKGKTPVLAASERAVTLVVTGKDGERNVPIRLLAKEVTVIRL